jgi:CRP/FNR family cyclic AMP-dependent transcriptional regulator
MNNQEKQIHVRLTSEVYRKLKGKCAYEELSVQDYVANLIGQSLTQHAPRGKINVHGRDSKQEILETIKECALLNDFPEAELKKLADTANLLHFSKGQLMLREQEIPEALHIVANGLVKIYKTSPSGKEFTVDILPRGEIFGGMSLISGFAYSSGAQAMEEVDIVAIPKESFLAFTSHNPEITARINRLENVRKGDLFTKLIGLVTDRAEQRVSKVLNELLEKYGSTLSLTHKDIAEMSGTTSETVTRVLTNLKNRGAIRVSRGKMQIINKDKLLF